MPVMEIDAPVHPSEDKLRDFGCGYLDAEEAAAVEEHLAFCDSCCLLVEETPNDSFLGQLRAARAAPTIDTWANLAVPTLFEEPDELANHPRYRVLRPLGRGGMGAVYLAEHRRMGRSVALKIINPEFLNQAGSLPRFQQEVKAAAKLDHPNIVAAYDADQAGNLHFLVMEYVEGQNLADYVSENGPLPISQACDIIRQAALGLEHAHERGMVHRDIKPHNLMLTPSGQVKVLDFGLARFAAEPFAPMNDGAMNPGPALTGAGAVMGSADYIAPEQARDAHSADSRSDIYSLGCTLYYLLTGSPPFPEGTSPEKLRRHGADEPRPLNSVRPEAPEELARVAAKMLAKKPANRHKTATEVAAALGAFANTPDKPRKKGRAWLVLAGLFFAALVFAAAAGVIRLSDGNREIVIETDDPKVEVVVLGDRIVRIVDPKSGQAYKLDRKDLTVSLFDDKNGLSMVLGDRPVVLKRQGKRLAAVWLEQKRVPGEQLVILKTIFFDIERAEAKRILGRWLENPVDLDAKMGVLSDSGGFVKDLHAAKGRNEAVILAEPNHATLNGFPVSFLYGGKFPVPIVSRGGATRLQDGATRLQGTSFANFGVSSMITPKITGKNRIRLDVDAKVGPRNASTGADLGPNLPARSLQTTVEFNDGQAFIVRMRPAKNVNERGEPKADVPSRDAESTRETYILIIWEAIRSLEYREVPPLPGSDGPVNDAPLVDQRPFEMISVLPEKLTLHSPRNPDHEPERPKPENWAPLLVPPPIPALLPHVSRPRDMEPVKSSGEQSIQLELIHLQMVSSEAARLLARWLPHAQEGSTKFGIPVDGAGLLKELGTLKALNKVRTLAEPCLMTRNGMPAQFVTGAEIPIQAISLLSARPKITYKNLGTAITILPTALPTGKIWLEADVTISDVIPPSRRQLTNHEMPQFTTYGAQVTIKLNDGQLVVIGMNCEAKQDDRAAKAEPKNDNKNDSSSIILVTPRLLGPPNPTPPTAAPKRVEP